jgi:very-short-patch-repair endonuclease
MSPPRVGKHNISSKKQFRKDLRNSLTAAEAVLWQSLKGRQLEGKKFRRQTSVGRYIVDFYCPERGLVVELDGERHFSLTIDSYEAERTTFLESEGLKVIRFENREDRENIEGVLDTTRRALWT